LARLLDLTQERYVDQGVVRWVWISGPPSSVSIVSITMSERGFVVSFEILGQLLDLKRHFPSGVSYRVHAFSRFGQRVEAS
jgi:hypothetical protein